MGGTQALGLALGGPSELPGTTAWLLNITVTDVRASAPATVCRAQLKQLPFLCSAPFGVALMRSSPQGPGGPQVQEDNGNTMATLTQVDLSSPGEGAPPSVFWGWRWLLGGGDLWAGFYRMN